LVAGRRSLLPPAARGPARARPPGPGRPRAALVGATKLPRPGSRVGLSVSPRADQLASRCVRPKHALAEIVRAPLPVVEECVVAHRALHGDVAGPEAVAAA